MVVSIGEDIGVLSMPGEQETCFLEGVGVILW